MNYHDARYRRHILTNDVLERIIADLLKRPVGRPLKKPIVLHAGFQFRVANWKQHNRVAVKIEWLCEEPYPQVGVQKLESLGDDRGCL